ncbi:hypothetical protein PTKIN_Ptkin01aG0129100 [Pterospermum kingtungense]
MFSSLDSLLWKIQGNGMSGSGTKILLREPTFGLPTETTKLQTRQVTTPAAQLLDSGNLILKEANTNDDIDHYLWQSFDHPTDTLLPDMKLGWDLNTGFNRFPEVFLWNKQDIEYRSGRWNGLRFSGVPEMKPLDYITFNFVTNQDEVYYSFSISNKNLFSRLVVTPTGILQRFTWVPDTNPWNPFWYAPKDQCDYYRECGPYGICDNNASPVCKCPRGFSPKNQQAWNLRDGSDGCIRETALDCAKDKSMNLKDCEALCTRNCSCTAYSNSDIQNGGNGCVLWTGDLFDLRQYADGGQDLYVGLAASDLGDSLL